MISATALRNIRVLDCARDVAGQYAAKLFADMGADVVRVEPPPAATGRDQIGRALNSGKRSVTIDVTRPEGAALLRDLVLDFDVLIEDMPSGEMERLGLGYETLAEIKPRLVHVSVTPFGLHGPDAGRDAADIELLARAGLDATGAGPYAARLRAGIHAFAAASAAMFTSHIMETGHQVEVAAIEALASTLPPGARVTPAAAAAAVDALPPPFTLGAASAPPRPSPAIGEHTAHVLLSELGLDAAELGRLRAEGIV